MDGSRAFCFETESLTHVHCPTDEMAPAANVFSVKGRFAREIGHRYNLPVSEPITIDDDGPLPCVLIPRPLPAHDSLVCHPVPARVGGNWFVRSETRPFDEGFCRRREDPSVAGGDGDGVRDLVRCGNGVRDPPATFVKDGLQGVVADPFGSSLCLILAGLFFARRLYRLNVLTIGDYYRIRYNRTVEVLCTLCIVASYLGWVSAQIKALGLTFHVVTGGVVIRGSGWSSAPPLS